MGTFCLTRRTRRAGAAPGSLDPVGSPATLASAAPARDAPGAYSITGARNAHGRHVTLYVRDGLIVDEPPPGAHHIDADGLIALPGLVDPHTHLREPGNTLAETITTGTTAAARGGYTAVLAMPNTAPATHGVPELEWLTRRVVWMPARAQVVPIGAITRDRAGLALADITGLARRGVRVFSDDGSCVASAVLMRAALAAVRPFDGVIAQHAQDPSLAGERACCADAALAARLGVEVWPSVAESVIVARDVQLAADTGARLHVCHVTCPETVDIIRWAKARGVRVTAEVTPHHLLLSTDRLATGDTTFKVNPPLRPAVDVAVLRAALADGTIDMVATDHAPHTATDKRGGLVRAKPGVTGLEQALGIVLETMVSPGLLTWGDVVRVMSAAPAALARLTAQGHPLTPGHPANIVLIDPARRAIVDREDSASRSRNNPYHGFLLPDPVQWTMRAGAITYDREAGMSA